MKVILTCTALVAAGSLSLFLLTKLRTKQKILIKKHILNKESYAEITTEIRKNYSKLYWAELNKSRCQRRAFQVRSAEYEKCVSSFQRKMKNLLEESQKSIISKYRISETVFQESVNYYDSDPRMKEYGEKLVQPLPPEHISSNLNKEEAKKILNFYSMRLKEFESECPDLDEYLVINNQIEDEIYRNFKIEIEELNAVFEKYKNEFEEIVEPLKNQTSYILASTDDSFEL